MTPTTPLDPSVRGNQPKGPARWKRAKQWARANPHTKAGRQYLAREAAARAVQGAVGDKAWLHWRTGLNGGKPAYDGQTCSTFCAMLELQVRLGCAGLEELHEKTQRASQRREDGMAYVPYLEERPAGSKRRGKCAACGGPVT